MVEEQLTPVQERFKEIDDAQKKEAEKKQTDFLKQLVTRDKLERDFKEDKI